VLGGSGPLAIPTDAGEVNIAPDGSVSAGSEQVGQLMQVRFSNPNLLQPAGTTLFQAPAEVIPEPGTSKVLQGYREGANTQVVNEMVAMIAGMRQFEAAQRALRTISESVQLNTRPQ
jgi:flagellar basal body rod protein FlgG